MTRLPKMNSSKIAPTKNHAQNIKGEPDLRGEPAASSAFKFRVRQRSSAVFKKTATPAVFPESPSSTGNSGARSTHQTYAAAQIIAL
jgi:hypothetical protein